ncbi:hypothetical protein EVAR_92911_1 [Eumeta japonica]|uniref:Uncharacterized protein n=1 Tax=Eumeta variegata TaxID=151549 RepID=A0A4C1TA71_EUMVA|nr:hypothetical protein EVAR_92911_1 [Eumeta japonica]
MSDKDEAAIFTPHQPLCRTPPSNVTVLNDLLVMSATNKWPRECPGEMLPPSYPRRDAERSGKQTNDDTEGSPLTAAKTCCLRTSLRAPWTPPRCRCKSRRCRKAIVRAVQTTSIEAAEKIKKADPPTLWVTEPRSQRPIVALRNISGDQLGKAMILAL